MNEPFYDIWRDPTGLPWIEARGMTEGETVFLSVLPDTARSLGNTLVRMADDLEAKQ